MVIEEEEKKIYINKFYKALGYLRMMNYLKEFDGECWGCFSMGPGVLSNHELMRVHRPSKCVYIVD